MPKAVWDDKIRYLVFTYNRVGTWVRSCDGIGRIAGISEAGTFFHQAPVCFCISLVATSELACSIEAQPKSQNVTITCQGVQRG